MRSDRSLHRQSLYDDTDFAAPRDDPEFRALVGHPDTKGWSRNDGWRRDVDYLYAEVARTSQDYAGRQSPAAFTRRYQQLKGDVPRLSDEAIFVGMNGMLAVLHQGQASRERCNFHGDASHVVLPFSRIEGEISTARWNLNQNVFDGRREMSPDVPVQLTARAYFAGQDPALAAVFRLIGESRAKR